MAERENYERKRIMPALFQNNEHSLDRFSKSKVLKFGTAKKHISFHEYIESNPKLAFYLHFYSSFERNDSDNIQKDISNTFSFEDQARTISEQIKEAWVAHPEDRDDLISLLRESAFAQPAKMTWYALTLALASSYYEEIAKEALRKSVEGKEKSKFSLIEARWLLELINGHVIENFTFDNSYLDPNSLCYLKQYTVVGNPECKYSPFLAFDEALEKMNSLKFTEQVFITLPSVECIANYKEYYEFDLLISFCSILNSYLGKANIGYAVNALINSLYHVSNGYNVSLNNCMDVLVRFFFDGLLRPTLFIGIVTKDTLCNFSFFQALLIDSCRAHRAFPPALVRCMRNFFNNSATCILDWIQLNLLARWFAFHLSNFEFKWPLWDEWANIVNTTSGQDSHFSPSLTSFVRITIDFLTRLSYKERLEAILPASLHCFITQTGFEWVLNDIPSFGSSVFLEKLKSKCSPLEIINDINTSEPEKLLYDFLVSILWIGNKTLSHTINIIDRYASVLVHLISIVKTNQTFLMLNALNDYFFIWRSEKIHNSDDISISDWSTQSAEIIAIKLLDLNLLDVSFFIQWLLDSNNIHPLSFNLPLLSSINRLYARIFHEILSINIENSNNAVLHGLHTYFAASFIAI